MANQEAYIESIRTQFKMQHSKATSTPMNGGIKLIKEMSPQTEEDEQKAKVPARKWKDALCIHLSQCARPDILFAVNQLMLARLCEAIASWSETSHRCLLEHVDLLG